MALAITTEQEQLGETVGRFAIWHAPIDKTRAAVESIAAGELPSWWPEFVLQTSPWRPWLSNALPSVTTSLSIARALFDIWSRSTVA